MHSFIDSRSVRLDLISTALREAPLPALRQLLPDQEVLDACAQVGYRFRKRLYDPVVTLYHFLLKAIGREESFAATWQELWSTVAAQWGLSHSRANSSALAQARCRFPIAALDILVHKACELAPGDFCAYKGMRLLALDSTTVSMPRTDELVKHFGVHRTRSTTTRYPLATFCSLLSVGTSLILDHRFGPFDPGEIRTASPLLKRIGPGDLLLADRRFAGSPTLARLSRQGGHFLMRKNARLIVERLPVVRQLGRDDFITQIPMSNPARKLDPSLPEKVRVRMFRARWTSPAGEKVHEWFATSLTDPKRFGPKQMATLYHQRWRIETSFEEFKTVFGTDVLRSKTVDNVYKEFRAHVLAYQLVRHLIVEAAAKHRKNPTHISFLHAARWVISFCSRMSAAPAWKLPGMYQHLLDAIASTEINIRPGRLEPRALTREWKKYPHLRTSRSQWRTQRLKENKKCLS